MLYFARLDQFEDVFEAEVPYANINNIPSYVDLERQKNSYKKLSNFIRVVTYITCFHISSFESAAMWKLYSKDMGIAIQTNTGRLIEALKNEPQKIFIGKVKYIDEYKNNIERIDNFGLSYIKRRSFMYEQELRCSIVRSDDLTSYDFLYYKFSKPKGYNAIVDLEKLIEKIYISPYAPDYILEVVQDILKKFNYNLPVIKSNLFSLN